MTDMLFDVAPEGDPDVTLGTCPACGCREARIRPRPDTKHHAELRCPECHHFRWLPKPRGPDAMTTANATARPNPITTAADPWEMKVGGGGGGGDYVCCPAGTHPGTIVGLFHVGHQTEASKEKGQVEVNRLILAFELSKRRPDGRPFLLSKRYTWSMHEKSNFYRDVVAITRHKFKEGESFNPLALAGLPVMVSVTNTQSGEKTYHDVASVGAYPEEFPEPREPTCHPVVWSVLTGEPFPAGLDWLPYVYGKSIPELAAASAEARARGGLAPAAAGAAAGDDDIPF